MTTEDRIKTLEAQIDRLEARQDQLRHELTQAQLDQWYARIEDLEVQAHLGAMETSDKISELVHQLRHRWTEVKGQVDGAASTAADIVDSARSGIDRAIQEIRDALLDGKKLVKKQGPAKKAAKKAPAKRVPAQKASKTAPARAGRRPAKVTAKH
jgi:TolA-binding protein